MRILSAKDYGFRKIIIVWINDTGGPGGQNDDKIAIQGDTAIDGAGKVHPTNPGDIKKKNRKEKRYIYNQGHPDFNLNDNQLRAKTLAQAAIDAAPKPPPRSF